MGAIEVDDALALVDKILVDGHATTELDTMIRPRGTFGLQVDAQTVGGGEGGIGGTVAVEAHMVETILLALTQQAHPRRDIGGWIARLGEATVLDGATQTNSPAVEQNLTPVDSHLAHAEGDGNAAAAIGDLARIKIRIVFAPQTQRTLELEDDDGIVEQDPGGGTSDVGLDTQAVDERGSPQLDAPGDAIPVALCLVGDAVGVLSYTYILDAVVDLDGDGILATGLQQRRDIVLMGHTERQLMASLTTVDEDCGLDVRTLEVESYITVLPCGGHDDGALIPGRTYIMLAGREEERELHLSLDAIAGHVGIEVERRVVE